MRELRQLRLPQLVEARRKRESANAGAELAALSPIEATGHHPFPSTASEPVSPVTPTFSLRSPLRLSSSTSSLASSPTVRDSLDSFVSPKRPLTEVKEEPQEREEDVVMEDIQEDSDHHSFNYDEVLSVDPSSHRDGQSSPSSPVDYDWLDSPVLEHDYDAFHFSKRRRPDEASVLDGMTSRLGTRFPTLSRKWKSRRDGKSTSIIDNLPESAGARSRANSTRAPSLIDSLVDASERHDHQILATPRRSFSGDANDSPVSPIDVKKANANFHDGEDESDTLATTPLLPPMMAQFPSGISDEPLQSPLQSPKIVESPTAIEFPNLTPAFSGLPSPPLSTKPSVSSFHRRQLLPSAEIPPIVLADPQDEWANKLGHANFTIHPEPYLPEATDPSACKQFRADWDTARCNFMKHLARTGEHYSTTSKVHQLTEEKWAQTDAVWRRHNEVVLSRTADRADAPTPLPPKASSPPEPLAPLMKIPSTNGPRSEGKFPKVGEEGIVGPMVQEKPMVQQRSSRKRAFWKFLQGVLPGNVAFGRA